MNYLDIIIIIPLLWGAFKGFRNGLMVELASVISLITGIYVAIHFSDDFAQLLPVQENTNPDIVRIVSFALLFIIVLVLLYLFAKFLTLIIKSVGLGLVNKISGSVFGLIKFLLIVCLIILLIYKLNNEFNFMDSTLEYDSMLFNPLRQLAELLYNKLKIIVNN